MSILSNLKKRSIILGILFLAFSMPSFAEDFSFDANNPNHYQHNVYERENSLVKIPYDTETLTATSAILLELDICREAMDKGFKCTSFTPNPDASISFECEGLTSLSNGSGGWKQTGAPQACWEDLTICSQSNPSLCQTYKADDGQGGAVSIEIDFDTAGVYFDADSRCDSSFLQGNAKDHCIWPEGDLSHVAPNKSSGGFTGYTGDDMFRIPADTGGFLEYVAAGDVDKDYELKYIHRNSSGDASADSHKIMIPAGPNTTYTDYKRFIDDPISNFDVSKACYPFSVSLTCDTSAVTFENYPGECGIAEDAEPGLYTTVSEVPEEDLCAVGDIQFVAGDTNSWICKAINGMGVVVEEDAICQLPSCNVVDYGSYEALPASCKPDPVNLSALALWSFTDKGIIGPTGSHNGSQRIYTDANIPSNGAWSVSESETSSLFRFSFDRDNNTPQEYLNEDNHPFKDHVQNSKTQSGTARFVFSVPEDATLSVYMTGEAEIEDSNFEYMNFTLSKAVVNGTNYNTGATILQAASTADGNSYDAVSPAYRITSTGKYNTNSEPNSGAPVSSWGKYTVPVRITKGSFPSTIALTANQPYVIEVSVDSADPLYHIDAYYQFELVVTK